MNSLQYLGSFKFEAARKKGRNFFPPIFIKICAPPHAMTLIKNKWVSDTGKFGFNYFSAIFGEKVYVTGKLIKVKP